MIMMEMYTGSQLQKGGMPLVLLKGSGKALQALMFRPQRMTKIHQLELSFGPDDGWRWAESKGRKNNNNGSSIRYPPSARYGLFYLVLAASLWVSPFYS